MTNSHSASAPSSAALLHPLIGKTVLVTRAAGQSSQFTTLLQAQGATVLEMPTLEICPPTSWEALDGAIAQLNQFDWLILTSANGVDYFFERLAVQCCDLAGLKALKIAVVGQKTAASLQQHGVQPDFIPPNFVADSLVEHFPVQGDLEGLRILFPRVETGGREVLVKEFTSRGATVVDVPAYQSGCAGAIAPTVAAALNQGAVDVLTFASSKTVRCFWQLLQAQSLQNQSPQAQSLQAQSLQAIEEQTGDTDRNQTPELAALLNRICIASIGPQTSATCKKLLGRVDVEATDYTLEGLIQAIVRWSLAMRKGF